MIGIRVLASRTDGRLLHVLAFGMLLASGCRSPSDSVPPTQTLKLWSTWRRFAADAIIRFNASAAHVQVALQETQGSVEVVSAIHKGLADLGTAQADVVYLAYRDGIGDQTYAHTNLRGLAILWPSNLYISVANDSTARDFSDLQGKRVGIPPRQSTGAFMSRVLLEAYGMTDQDIRPSYQVESRSFKELERGELDAVIWAYPLVTSPVFEQSRSARTRLLSISPTVSHRLRATYPFLSRVTLPAGVADQEKAPVVTVSSDVLLVCREGLSEALVYELVKTFFQSLPELAILHPEAALIDPRTASATPIPLHPGAARYYRERDALE